MRAVSRSRVKVLSSQSYICVSGAGCRNGHANLVLGGYVHYVSKRHKNMEYWRCTHYDKDGCSGRLTTVKGVVVNVRKVQFITSRRGHLQLVLDNYVYKKNNVKGSKVHWVCTHYYKTNCRSRVATTEGELHLTMTQHNHGPQLKDSSELVRDSGFLDLKSSQPDQFPCGLTGGHELCLSSGYCNAGPARFIRSRQGGVQLLLGGYVYGMKYSKRGKTYWRCTRYNRYDCRAHVTTCDGEPSFTYGVHDHPPPLCAGTPGGRPWPATLQWGEKCAPEFHRTERGGHLLAHGDFLYRLSYQVVDRAYWKCVDSNALKCRARAIIAAGRLSVSCGEHNHPPHHDRIRERRWITDKFNREYC
ncbi:FLYWCH-type zinc finger-containing protein 1-like [Bacillus rossius redtenbacheri]|uniref:FLYWCH-type zinc finger-containing protein 1-like n=1 Tax=Bacillus rossius redtenbacheri TaxID=93214 RepID=UPI002FDD3CEE